MNKPEFIAIDESGQSYLIDSKYPKKWLLDHFGRKHADKVYCGIKEPQHIGYVIAGRWLTIYRIHSWK